MIPVYEPDLNGNEESYLLKAFRSGWISSKGSYIDEFENKFAELVGCSYPGVAVSNGTVALHLALLGIGIKPEDEVLVPNFTYVACANTVRYVNAVPVFYGSNLNDLQPNIESAASMLTSRTKAIILPHMYGSAADVIEFKKLALKENLYLIEDCAEAIGTSVGDSHAGSWGDVSTFSFFGNKTLTTGEGGMVFSPHPEVREKIRKLKGQGLAKPGTYFHDVVGFNYRMTNLQAAIGVAQTERAHDILRRKRANHQIYKEYLFDDSRFKLLEPSQGESSYWIETLVFSDININLEPIRKLMHEKGVETRPGFSDITSMPMYSGNRSDKSKPMLIGNSVINLPSSPLLTAAEIKYICESLIEICN